MLVYTEFWDRLCMSSKKVVESYSTHTYTLTNAHTYTNKIQTYYINIKTTHYNQTTSSSSVCVITIYIRYKCNLICMPYVYF